MELEKLIATGEGDRLEFKKTITHPDKIARTLVSFANSRGGTILVGVMDNGTICGIDPEEEKHSLLQATQFYTNPEVKVIFKENEVDGIIVLKVKIPESNQKPHVAQVKPNDWRAYIRVNDESVQTSKLVLKSLKKEEPVKPQLPLTKIDIALLVYLKEHRRITLKQFMYLVNISKRRANQILVNLVLHGVLRHHDKEKEPYYTLS